jgi:hypothetical protein
MDTEQWTWADLDDEKIRLLSEAEQTLGADILMAYDQDGQPEVKSEHVPRLGLQVSPLDESQIECLQGLENQINAVVIAYQKRDLP